jgi:ATP-dependent RNA helicase DHX8/PRP22
MLKLKEIGVVNKLMTILDQQLGVKEKVLAEFILDLAKGSPNVDVFDKHLADKEADFPSSLVNSLYATITKMLPDHF